MTNIEKLKPELVQLALQIGANEGKSLDFTPDSVRDVEVILGRMHDYYKQTKNADGLFGVALEFGA